MRKFVLIGFFAVAALPLAAQQAAPAVKVPRPSQKQVLTQTIGNTDMTINYSRPGVKGRPIWGALVPWNQVWRTGANEATTIAFSDDVTINGQPLPKGTYSLHSIPAQSGEWTLIFNKTADQWGSYSYDEKQDALRVKAKAQKSDFHEWMTFDVPALSFDDATVMIRWENIAVPFTVGTGTTQKTLAAMRAAVAAAKPDDYQVRARAASFALNAGVDAPEARKWIDESIAINESVGNLWIKAQLQASAGDVAGARATVAKIKSKATEKDKNVMETIDKTVANWK